MPERKKARTIVDVTAARKEDILESWIKRVKQVPHSDIPDLVEEGEVRQWGNNLLETLSKAIGYEEFRDISQPQFKPMVELLKKLCTQWADAGVTPSDVAGFVFSLRDALLDYLQSAFGNDEKALKAEILKVNQLTDQLGILTFETYASRREALISAQKEEIIELQKRTMLELSTPAIAIWDKILLVPLVGVIDTRRALQLVENLLEQIVATRSQVAILDVTGVEVIDTEVARHIIKAIDAAKMLGSEVILTGISPHAAQTLVQLNIDMSAFRTYGHLQIALEEAFRTLGLQLVSTS